MQVMMSDGTLVASASVCFDLTEDFVNHVRNRCGGVDDPPLFGNAFFRLMHAHNDFPLLWSATPVSWVLCHSLINPLERGSQVDIKDKYVVEEIDKLGEIPRTTA